MRLTDQCPGWTSAQIPQNAYKWVGTQLRHPCMDQIRPGSIRTSSKPTTSLIQAKVIPRSRSRRRLATSKSSGPGLHSSRAWLECRELFQTHLRGLLLTTHRPVSWLALVQLLREIANMTDAIHSHFSRAWAGANFLAICVFRCDDTAKKRRR